MKKTTLDREELIQDLRDARRELACTQPGSIAARNLARKIARINRELDKFDEASVRS